MPRPTQWAVATLSALAFAPGAASAELQRFEYSEAHMGTGVRLVLYAAGGDSAAAAARAAFTRIAAIDSALSDYDADSELSRLCRQSGQGPRIISQDLLTVLERALELSETTRGAFDVTLGPLSQLWRRARRRRELPSAEQLAEARQRSGYQLLELESGERRVGLRVPGMRLDLGGIAKGFAADEALAVLGSRGIDRALVAVAGDVVVGRAPPDRAGWRVEVASPTPGGAALERLELEWVAVSTSGDAEQHVEIDGVRYSHILDPRTGLGLTQPRQVTIVAADGMSADSLATAVCVLGPEAGIGLVDATPGVAALMVVGAGQGLEKAVSSGWAGLPRAGPQP